MADLWAKYGGIDRRWIPVRQRNFSYSLEHIDSQGRNNVKVYVVQNPDGSRVEMSEKEYNEGGFEPVSRSKFDLPQSANPAQPAQQPS